MASFKFNRTNLSKVEPPTTDAQTGKTKNQELYWDTVFPGLGLRVTKAGAKSYIFETRLNGKRKRITIGSMSTFTPEQARREAQKLSYQIKTGIDPTAEKKRNKVQALTLEQVASAYKESRKTLKDSTREDIDKVFKQVLPDWLGRPIVGITADMVSKRHSEHGRNRSEAKANAAMRYLRAIFNFAIATYSTPQGEPLIKTNPVARLSETRAWFKNRRKQTVIHRTQLKPWLKTVLEYPNNNIRDYLVLTLFTGLRRNEGLSLRWSDIDLNDRTLTARGTKNHRDHILPLTKFLTDLLSQRKAITVGSQFVFPGAQPNSHYKGPTTALINNIANLSGVRASVHDLRRTFATIAESLGVPAYQLKALLNHKTNNDVTAGYIIRDVESLRAPMEEISRFILEEAGLE